MGGGLFPGDYFIRYSTGSLEDRYQDKHKVTLSANRDDFITGNTTFPAMENFSNDIKTDIGVKYLRYPDQDYLIADATAGKIYGGSQTDFNLMIYMPFRVFLSGHYILHDDLGLDSMIAFSSAATYPPYYIGMNIQDDYESPSTNWTYSCMTYCKAYDNNYASYDFQCEIRINGNR